MTYNELRSEIQTLLAATDYAGVVALITPDNVDTVERCLPELIGPVPVLFDPSYLYRFQIYETLDNLIQAAATVDGALFFFNSAYAGVVSLGGATLDTLSDYERLLAPDYLTLFTELDTLQNNKIVAVC